MKQPLIALAIFLSTIGAAEAKAPRVVASIAPIHSLVASVMAGVGEPELLIPPTLSEHDYSLKPSDLRRIAKADLVVWIGKPLEFYLADPLSVESVPNLELIEAEGLDPHLYGGGAAHPAGGEETAAFPEDDHEHLGLDPHVWLDPVRAERIVAAVAVKLAEIDPANADRYRANAAATQRELAGLDEEVRVLLAGVAGRAFITFHGGYSYFVERYGLNQVGQVTLEREQRLGAATVRALRKTIASERVACAFIEPQFDSGALEALAGDTAMKVGTLDALGLGLEKGRGLYASLLRKNAIAIEDCLAPTS